MSSLDAHSVACGRNGDIVLMFIRADDSLWVAQRLGLSLTVPEVLGGCERPSPRGLYLEGSLSA